MLLLQPTNQKKIVDHKIKKLSDEFTLDLTKTKDILTDIANLPKKPFTVGFCLETDLMIENAKEKSIKKNSLMQLLLIK